MGTTFQDVRYAFRQLRRAPVFTATVLVTMALAIGAAAALAGVLKASVWNALPYTDAGRLVTLEDHNRLKFVGGGMMAVGRTTDLATLQQDGHPVFQSIAFYYPDTTALAIAGHKTQPLQVAAVSGSFFAVAGSAPAMGRTLVAADDVPNAPLVAVLSDTLWRTAFAADPNVVGQVVHIGGRLATVVGVMGAEFQLPESEDAWYPGHISAAQFAGYRGEGSRFVHVVGRLDARETLAEAAAAVAGLSQQLATRYPTTDAVWEFKMLPLRDALFGRYRRGLNLLLAAVGLVLLVAATNLAGLELARNAAREGEFEIRGALGITRGRLLRQLLTENLLLAAMGSALGVGTGTVLLRVLLSRIPPGLLVVERPHVDMGIALAGVALASAVGVVAGVVPWLQAARLFANRVRGGGQRVAGARWRWSGGAFVVTQIALSLVLLTVAACVVQSLYALLHTPLGFDTSEVSTFNVDLPWTSDMGERHRLHSALEQELAARPGVTGVGAISALPMTGFSVRLAYDVAGQPTTPAHDTVTAEGRDITPGYAPAMRIPLLAGRLLTAQDALPGALRVFLANHAFAQRYFSGRSVVGQHLSTSAEALRLPSGAPGSTDAGEIVGVLADVQGTGGALGSAPQPELYRPEVGGWPHMQFAVRTAAPDPGLATAVRGAVGRLFPAASVSHFDTLAEAVDRSEAQPRLTASLLAGVGGFALLLTAVGTYGLAAFSLSQRGREFAVRMAMGSTREAIAGLLLRRMVVLLGAGVALGMLCGVAVSRVLRSLVDATLTVSLLPVCAVVALMTVAVLGSVVGPALRAAGTNPAEALRAE